MRRRKFLLAALSCSICHALQAQETGKPGIAPKESRPTLPGCLGLKSATVTLSKVALAITSGSKSLDESINQQAFDIANRYHFGSQLPGLRFTTGPQADNAWVTRDVIVKGTTATVVLGTHLIQEWVYSSLEYGGDSVVMVLAHELAHVFQIYKQIPESLQSDPSMVPVLELQADFIAGWYLGVARHVKKDAINAAGRKLFELGDFELAVRDHGLGIERSTALYMGWSLANTSGDFEIDDVAKAAMKFARGAVEEG